VKVSIVQFSPKLGEVEYNIGKMAELAQKAVEEGARLCIFPELSVTGYNVQDLIQDVAVTPEDERLLPLLKVSEKIGMVVGVVEETKEHTFYNSAFYLERGMVVHIHRKVYLPTYGMFDEARFFATGERVTTFNSPAGKACTLICEDLWHFSTVYLAFIQGVKCIFAPSASPARGCEKGLPANIEIWMNMAEFYSRMTGSYFFFANRVGVEDGFVFPGMSFVTDPYGAVVATASALKEEVLTVEVHESLIRSARLNLPLLRDERPEIVARHLRSFLK